MTLTAVRLTALGVLFLITFVVGTVPVYIFQLWSKRRALRTANITSRRHVSILSSNLYIQLLTQIGGGVLFFTVFVHMIPEIRDNFEIYLQSNESIFSNGEDEDGNKIQSIGDLSIPYLELAICSGFFAIYLAEGLMHTLLLKHGSHEDSKEEVIELETSTSNGTSRNRAISIINCEHNEPVLIAIKCNKSKCDASAHIHHGIEGKEPLFVRLLHGLVIIAAFSIHSLFDGISIGIKTQANEIWTMFIAIASHKLLISFIISVELYEKCSNFILVVFNMTLFSIMSPIGILIVILAEESLDSNSEANPIVVLLSAISAGTIVYIVFFEILQKERVSKLPEIVQFVSMAVGFGLMFLITTTMRED